MYAVIVGEATDGYRDTVITNAVIRPINNFTVSNYLGASGYKLKCKLLFIPIIIKQQHNINTSSIALAFACM